MAIVDIHRFRLLLYLAVMFDPFLAMVGPMGEGGVNLNVGFTFSLLFQVFHGEQRNCRVCIHLAWGRILGDRISVL